MNFTQRKHPSGFHLKPNICTCNMRVELPETLLPVLLNPLFTLLINMTRHGEEGKIVCYQEYIRTIVGYTTRWGLHGGISSNVNSEGTF